MRDYPAREGMTTRYRHGTVDHTLQRIEATGYTVVRLWCAEGGVTEDDHLGLAVIGNRRR